MLHDHHESPPQECEVCGIYKVYHNGLCWKCGQEAIAELYRKIDTLSTNNALLGKTITRLSHRLEMVRGITKTLASTVETLSDSD